MTFLLPQPQPVTEEDRKEIVAMTQTIALSNPLHQKWEIPDTMPKLNLPELYAALLRRLKYFMTFPLIGPHVPTQPFSLYLFSTSN